LHEAFTEVGPEEILQFYVGQDSTKRSRDPVADPAMAVRIDCAIYFLVVKLFVCRPIDESAVRARRIRPS
jgi:hypothetical protein